MDQTSGTTPPEPPAQDAAGGEASQPAVEQPGFGSRGRARRRARFLRRARELAYRDLGGLVFSLHRFGQRNDALVLAKLSTLGHIDAELRAIEAALEERRPLTVLREAGITACPRCAAIHASEDRFCPNCGLPMRRDAELPIAGAPAGSPATAGPAPGAAQPSPAEPVMAPSATFPAAEPPTPPGTPAPAPAQPAPAGSFATPVPAPPSAPSQAGGRSPTPPTRVPPAQPAGPAPTDESTEILRPRATGS